MTCRCARLHFHHWLVDRTGASGDLCQRPSNHAMNYTFRGKKTPTGKNSREGLKKGQHRATVTGEAHRGGQHCWVAGLNQAKRPGLLDVSLPLSSPVKLQALFFKWEEKASASQTHSTRQASQREVQRVCLPLFFRICTPPAPKTFLKDDGRTQMVAGSSEQTNGLKRRSQPVPFTVLPAVAPN